jgi:PmbA protein
LRLISSSIKEIIETDILILESFAERVERYYPQYKVYNPRGSLDFIRDGVLLQFAYDLKTAYRYGKDSTASAIRAGYGGSPSIGIHNLVLEGDRSQIDDERALFVHDIVGAHTANPLSGDFSVELANACWMEGGEFNDPVRKAMYAGNVFDILQSIVGLGTKSRIVGSMIIPSVRLQNQHLIGE